MMLALETLLLHTWLTNCIHIILNCNFMKKMCWKWMILETCQRMKLPNNLTKLNRPLQELDHLSTEEWDSGWKILVSKVCVID